MGYGFTEGVLNQDDSHHRGFASIAGSLRPLDWLAFGVRLDGRYDRHSSSIGSDDGWTGDVRALVRAQGMLTDELGLGGQLVLWLPGEDAPSIDLDATSLDALTYLTHHRRGSPLYLSGYVGYRLDQSAAAAHDADRLSRADRLALGVSQTDALLLGLGADYRIGRVELLGEWSWDFLVGDNAPAADISPMRLSAGVRSPLTNDGALALQVVVEGSLSSRPTVDVMQRLVPVEPRLSALVGLSMQLPRASAPVVSPEHESAGPPPPPPRPRAELQGRVRDAAGKPIADARITLSSPPGREERSDAAGRFRFDGLEPGEVAVTVHADGYRDQEGRGRALPPGASPQGNSELELVLERLPRPGQLRGNVRAFTGRALPAQVRIEPTGQELVADADGNFAVSEPPGKYVVVVSVPGYITQRRPVQLEEDGVTLLNVELRKAAR
jgi:hypothetical protein